MFARQLARNARPMVTRRAAPKRNFSAPAGEVQYEGAEAVVRKYLPKDEHVVAGMIGFYAGLYLLSKVVFGGGTFFVCVSVWLGWFPPPWLFGTRLHRHSTPSLVTLLLQMRQDFVGLSVAFGRSAGT